MSLVKMENVQFAYEKDTPILSDINLDIEPGEAVGLIGANGVGKSTLMKLLVGLCDNYQGSVEIQGISVEKQNIEDRKSVV